MLYMFQLEYGSEKKLAALPPETYAALRAVVWSLPEDPSKFHCYETLSTSNEGMALLAQHEFSVRFTDKQPAGDHLMWVKLQDRIAALEGRVGPHQQPFDRDDDSHLLAHGAGVHVHIPDLGLLCMTEVTHLDDCCTDELQGYLDQGWRILAVCPPNAQRRPDYILGRATPRPA